MVEINPSNVLLAFGAFVGADIIFNGSRCTRYLLNTIKDYQTKKADYLKQLDNNYFGC